ncbi:AMP-binding protein [bacterium]|nr:AMP-binding protein [bacterium]
MTLPLKQRTVRDFLEYAAGRYPDLPSIAFAGETAITYHDLYEAVCEFAVRLVRHHIHSGSKVAILGDNSPNWVIAYLAVTGMGAVAVPILPGFSDANVRHIIRDSESQAVIVSARYRTAVEDFDTPSLSVLVSLEDLSFKKVKDSLSGHVQEFLKKIHSRFGSEPKDSDVFRSMPGPEPDDLLAIIYTSGTTGSSKGVMLTHNNVLSDVELGLERFPLTPDDRFLSILPLSHTYEATGGMLCPLASGVSIYYMKGMPTPGNLLAGMESVRPTGVLTVPLVVDKIYRRRILPNLQKSRLTWALYQRPFFRKRLNKIAGRKMIQSLGGCLRFFMFGGAALNRDTEQFLVDAGISYSTGYGMTETSPILTINPFGRVRMGSCGQAIPGIEMKIHDPDPETGTGEICVRGPIVMRGYYKNQEETDQIFLEGGWLRTGDLGYFDGDGYLFIRGRSKNVIVGPNGENIYPEIIEQQLTQSPFIDECVVYQHQQRIVAKVHLDQDNVDQFLAESAATDTDADRDTRIRRLLETERLSVNVNLPAFSQIRALEIFPDVFEKTPTNKIKRYLYIPEEE